MLFFKNCDLHTDIFNRSSWQIGLLIDESTLYDGFNEINLADFVFIFSPE